ncbi:DfrB family trimethoprim-resistant dihydrofolate reductase [Pseudomonas aeruginosa]|nr:DfrB family trimethoprim-resistant dihydrofolate reductase [Pseudomonas aeruginosa]
MLDGGWSALYAAPIAQTAPQGKFRMGDIVKKSTGSEWEGRVVGWYSTEQTPEGYAVESSAHRNSVQIYPAKALEAVE